jgi:GNAT superfamily N-acetyltransferase
MTIRVATAADKAAVIELWREFEQEVPEPAHRGEPDPERERQEIAELLASGLVLLAEDASGPIGLAFARQDGPLVCLLDTIYVRSSARRHGVGKALLAEAAAWCRERGASHMTLEVLASNNDARAIYEHLGFEEESRTLVIEVETLEQRFSRPGLGHSFGSIHVQTDDLDAVARAVWQFVPRLPGHSLGSAVLPPRNGWTAIYDELCDREPDMLRRLAVEVSDRMGAVVLAIGVEQGALVRYMLLERGLVVDEYSSVPEYYGSLPPGDVIALGANPTVLARLTGADPTRVREVARTASSPDELPPAAELLGAIATAIRVEGATHGFAQAKDLPEALLLERS